MRQWMCAAVVAWLAAFPVLAQAPAADEIVAAAGTHRLIVLGEKHGTVEIPALVADLAARYADEGPLLLALEVRRSEHVALSNYLRAGDARVGTLRRRAAWSMPPERNDGRRSEAMLAVMKNALDGMQGAINQGVAGMDADLDFHRVGDCP